MIKYYYFSSHTLPIKLPIIEQKKKLFYFLSSGYIEIKKSLNQSYPGINTFIKLLLFTKYR